MRSLIVAIALTVPFAGCSLTPEEQWRYYENRAEIYNNTQSSERHLDDRDAAMKQLDKTYQPWGDFLFEILFGFWE